MAAAIHIFKNVNRKEFLIFTATNGPLDEEIIFNRSKPVTKSTQFRHALSPVQNNAIKVYKQQYPKNLIHGDALVSFRHKIFFC